MDIQSERISISEESIFLEEDVVLKFDGGLSLHLQPTLKENSNLINFNNNADIFLNDLYLQAQRGKFDRSNNTLSFTLETLTGKNLIYLLTLILRKELMIL